MSANEDTDEVAGGEAKSAGSSATLTLVSLAHGINHAQATLKPLVFPPGSARVELRLLGVASAVGGSLQLAAGALGRILPRHYIRLRRHGGVVCFGHRLRLDRPPKRDCRRT
jgi:hypothetical protein